MTPLQDPTLAQPIGPMSHGNPVGSPAMMTGMGGPFAPGQFGGPMSQQDSAGIDLSAAGRRQQTPPPQLPPELAGYQEEGQPFAVFHNDPAEGEEAPGEEEITELTDLERQQFAMLMNIGKQTKVIDVFGHPVVIESISVGDDLRIGMYRKDFLGDQLSAARAYQIATCACGIRMMDGAPLYVPISMMESDEEIFQKKVAKVIGLYPPVVSAIYNGIRDLDKEFAEMADKLGKYKG